MESEELVGVCHWCLLERNRRVDWEAEARHYRKLAVGRADKLSKIDELAVVVRTSVLGRTILRDDWTQAGLIASGKTYFSNAVKKLLEEI